MKKLLSLLAVLTVCIAALVISASAATTLYSGTCGANEDGTNVIWALDDEGTLTISGTGAMKEYSGYSSYPWYRYDDAITKVVVKSGVTNIGSWAFGDYYDNLTSVTIPASVTAIGRYAFYRCDALTVITIPAGVTTIGDHAFAYCETLTTVTFAGTSKLQTIGEYAFYRCCDLTAVTIPASVTTIGDYAFDVYDYENALSVTIPSGSKLTSIGDYAFRGCDGTVNVTLPAGLTYLGKYAFADCDGTMTVNTATGSKLAAIGEGAFYSCDNLTAFTVRANVTEIGASAFEDTGLTTVTFAGTSKLQTIGAEAFRSCDNLTAFTIPASVTTIGEYAFDECSALTTVTTAGTGKLQTVGNYAFSNTALKKFTVPASVTAIGNYAFSNCDQLTAFSIPDTVTTLGTGIFSDCGYLTAVRLPAGAETVPAHMFSQCDYLRTVTIPGSVTAIGDSAFSGSGLTSLTIPDSVTSIGNYAFYYCSGLTDIVIPGSVKTIGDYAFYECDPTSLTLSEGLTTIGSYAFGRCFDSWRTDDISFVIPNSVTSIGSYAFYNCYYLDSVTLPAGLTEIADGLFSGCDDLDSITIPGKVKTIGTRAFYFCDDLTTVTIPGSVETIGNEAFQSCSNLTGVTIPGSVETMGVAAFDQCPSLTDVYYGGTQAKWDELMFANIGLFPSTATVHFGAMEITSNPQSVSLTPGSTAKFSVTASGGGLKYQWQYRTSASGKWANATASGNKTATLSVPATASRNGYQYRCRVTDENGTVLFSKAATLKVVGLKVTTQPVDANVTGGTAEFTVAANGNGMVYRWQYRTSADGEWAATTATGYKTDTLQVPATLSRYGYQYRCKITDENDVTVYSKAATLIVLPTVTGEPEDVLAAKDTQVKFTVEGKGVDLTYQWQYKVPGGKVWRNSPADGNDTDTLSLSATNSRNGNRYRCVITDRLGNQTTSDHATLTVVAPAIQTEPENMTGVTGETVDFYVEASGVGLTYRWQYRTSASGTWKATYATGYKTDTLTIPATADRDGYQYRCKVTDASGNVVYSEAAELTVIVLEFVAQPQSATLTAGKTAKFTVVVDGEELSYQWQYKTPTGNWTDSPATGSKTATLKVPATASRNGYQYRCIVTDGYGNNKISGAATLTVK